MSKIRTALIGVSGFGNTHYNDLLKETEAGRYQPVAATIINQDEEREKCEALQSFGCELFTDHREMLEKHGAHLDLTMIPTGIPLHAPMTMDALRAGSHVFVEKPVAAVVRDVRAMQKASEETGRFVAVGYQHIYQQETLTVKKALLSGRIGPIKSIHCLCLCPRADAYYERNRWVAKLKLGEDWVLDSPHNNAFSHYLNLILFYSGVSFEKSARLKTVQAEFYRARDLESFDTGALHVVTENNIQLHMYASHVGAQAHPPYLRLVGELGVIEKDSNGLAKLILNDGTQEILSRRQKTGTREQIMAKLAEKVADPNAFVCSLEMAGAQTLAINVAHESSAITSIPEFFRERTERDDSFYTVIPGLDEAFQRAYREGLRLRDLDLPWAFDPGEVIDVAASQTVKTGIPGVRT